MTRPLQNLLLLPLLAVGISILLLYCLIELVCKAVWEWLTYKTKRSMK
jgi:fructose-specific phosphotransferase system IIC component